MKNKLTIESSPMRKRNLINSKNSITTYVIEDYASMLVFFLPKGELACSPGQRSCPGIDRNTKSTPEWECWNKWPSTPIRECFCALTHFPQGSFADLGYRPILPSGENLNDLKKSKQQSRIVGIDYGLARIGISLSDPTKLIAAPLMTIATESKLELTVSKLLHELKKHAEAMRYEIAEIVIGLPLLLNGKFGFLADEVKLFAEQLQKLTSFKIRTWDERLTSVQAERSLRESNLSRKKRSKIVDQVAAVILLQSYLDFLHNHSS